MYAICMYSCMCCAMHLVAQACSNLCDPMNCSPPGSSVHGGSSGKNTRVCCYAFLQGNLPNPGIKPRSPTLQVYSLLSEPAGKPKNTGVDSLSLLQGNFSTQESNWGPLLCRWIPYQRSYQGILCSCIYTYKWSNWRAEISCIFFISHNAMYILGIQ